MPSRHREQRPQPAWTSTATRSPTTNSLTRRVIKRWLRSTSSSRSELDNSSHVLVAWGEAFVKGELALDQRGSGVTNDLQVGRADRNCVNPKQHLGWLRFRY